jgi:hypothetical protein
MPIEFLYWEPSISEPAGHVALRTDGHIYTFWPVVVRPDDTRGPVPGYINTDEDLEKFTAGLRHLALPALQQQGQRLPSGIQTYRIIFDNFEAIKNVDVKYLHEFFAEIDPTRVILDDLRQVVIDASVTLAKWVKQSEHAKLDIINAGNSTVILDLAFLRENDVKLRLVALQALANNLCWYAKVGANTDTALNNGVKMRLPMTLAQEMSGLRYYKIDRTRHNCASFVLDALNAGGFSNYTVNFDEQLHVSTVLQQTIRFNAESKREAPDAIQLAKTDSIKKLHLPLRLMGYGRRPITDWFGTTPRVLYQMVTAAISQHDDPVEASNCVIS